MLSTAKHLIHWLAFIACIKRLRTVLTEEILRCAQDDGAPLTRVQGAPILILDTQDLILNTQYFNNNSSNVAMPSVAGFSIGIMSCDTSGTTLSITYFGVCLGRNCNRPAAG